MTSRDENIVDASPLYAPEIAPLVWMMEDTRRRTKEALAGLSDEVVNWAPADQALGVLNSIGSILYHIAAIELDWLYTEILEIEGFPPELEPLILYEVREENGRLTPVLTESLATHLQRLDAGRALFLSFMQKLDAADFYRVRHLEPYDVTPQWVLHHLMQHEAEHRGQLMEVRRLAEAMMGAK
ncbi:MAG: DinB family protein [Caldilineaceae bacterium]